MQSLKGLACVMHCIATARGHLNPDRHVQLVACSCNHVFLQYYALLVELLVLLHRYMTCLLIARIIP